MNETLQTQIENIRNLANEELGDAYEESDIDDVISVAEYNGNIETAKKAILIIDELLKENEKLKQENKEGFALLDRSMTGWRNSQELPIKLTVDIVNLRDEIDLAIETLRYYARSSDPELAKETLIILNASL
jgi:hypothetical protein